MDGIEDITQGRTGLIVLVGGVGEVGDGTRRDIKDQQVRENDLP